MKILKMYVFINLAIFPDIVVSDPAEAAEMRPRSLKIEVAGGWRGGLG